MTPTIDDTDCFGKVASLFHSRCMSTQPSEQERVRSKSCKSRVDIVLFVLAAIALTICEMQTARQISIPMECQHFNPLTLGDVSVNLYQTQSTCVE